MELVLELLISLVGVSANKWSKRVGSILVWLGIVGIADGLAAVLHTGPVITLILTLGGALLASVVADRVAGIRLLPAPSLVATLGVGLVAGVLGGHVVASHFYLGSTAAEICMVIGATLTEMVLFIVYILFCGGWSALNRSDLRSNALADTRNASIVDRSPTTSCSLGER